MSTGCYMKFCPALHLRYLRQCAVQCFCCPRRMAGDLRKLKPEGDAGRPSGCLPRPSTAPTNVNLVLQLRPPNLPTNSLTPTRTLLLFLSLCQVQKRCTSTEKQLAAPFML